MGAWRALTGWLTEPDEDPDVTPIRERDVGDEEPRIDGRDIHAYGGLVLVGVGAWIVYPPAALVLVGAVLLYLGVWRMG